MNAYYPGEVGPFFRAYQDMLKDVKRGGGKNSGKASARVIDETVGKAVLLSIL
jgi:hypothetical protein